MSYNEHVPSTMETYRWYIPIAYWIQIRLRLWLRLTLTLTCPLKITSKE